MKTQTIKTGYNNMHTVYKTEFETIGEFKSYLEEMKVNNIFGNKQSSKGTGFSDKLFTGTSSYEEAETLLENGWDQGSKDLTTQLKIANAKMQDKEVKRAIFDIVGFQASVPRYIQGIPTNMVNKKTVKQKQKIVNLYKAITYNGGISAKEIMDDSVKFLQIVQAVEAKGIRVNAFVYFHSTNKNEQVVSTVKIKSSSEKLNISKMSFPLLHPSFLRRFMLRFLEVEPNIKSRGFKSGYGSPEVNEKKTETVLGKDCIVIPVLITEQKALNVLENIK